MPVQNAGITFKQSLESILYQTYKNWSLVVVNDSNNNDIDEIIKPYLNKVIYYKNNVTVGEGASINFVLDNHLKKHTHWVVHLPHFIADQNYLLKISKSTDPATSVYYNGVRFPNFLYKREVFYIVGAYENTNDYMGNYAQIYMSKFNKLKHIKENLIFSYPSQNNKVSRILTYQHQNQNVLWEQVIEPKLPLVLIIMTVYNGQDFLNTSIPSILNQTYKNFILCIVNDASTDNSVEIIKQYQDHRIKFIDLKENKGAYYARNMALQAYMSECDYWCLHGADDIMYSDKIEQQLKFMSDGYLATSCQYRTKKHSNGETVKIHKKMYDCILFKKDVFERLGYYDSDTRFGGDSEYLHRFNQTFPNKLFIIPYILYEAYIHNTNLTKLEPIRGEARREYINYYKNHNIVYRDFITSQKLKVIMLSTGDYAGSGYRIKEALMSVTDRIDITCVVRKKHTYGYNTDYVLSPSNKHHIQRLINSADIIHFKGDELPTFSWNGLNIPKDKKIIITVGGSGFRRGNSKVALEWHPIDQYLLNTKLRTCITPDLNYPQFKGIYTQHCLNTKKAPYTYNNDTFIIQHSPSTRAKKGTDDIILPVLYDLQKEGYDFKIELLENLTNDEVLRRKQTANIFIDQISETGF